jgi:uracil-DNA glycosylase
MDDIPANRFEALNNQIINCRQCERLVAWREQMAREKRRAFMEEEYWGKPVPGFGDPLARVLVLGLAPGAHGSNRTGRMFTGDGSGDFLYPALYRAGFASQPRAISLSDGLKLMDIYITAVGRCAPPDNKPLPQELANCRPFLLQELQLLTRLQGIVALGSIAFQAVLRIFPISAQARKEMSFGHGAFYSLGANRPWLLASYHPSRQNTQTGRLTPEMFDQIWQKASELLQ